MTVPDRTEYVYLIGSEATPLVKIGRSVDVSARLATIQNMSPVKLSVIWQTEGGSKMEASLHRWFKACRAHGEWFEFPDGNAPDQVVKALAGLAVEEKVRLAQQREVRKARKLRLVWTQPRRGPGRVREGLATRLGRRSNKEVAHVIETISQGRFAQQATERLEAASAEYKRIRDETVIHLVELGLSQSEISRQIGLSIPRVHEIARGTTFRVSDATHAYDARTPSPTGLRSATMNAP